MPRTGRLVVPGIPHHVTQRGNRRERLYFSPDDYRLFIKLLAASAKAFGTEIWAYCLMPNHFHLLAVPSSEAGLGKTFANPVRQYALHINARFGWTGHLWESRFASVPMEEGYLTNAIRYVSLNPVRAGLVQRAEDWLWSSVRAHLAGADDGLARVEPILSRFPDFRNLIEDVETDQNFAALRRAERRSAPLGAKEFVEKVLRNSDS